MTEIQRVRMIDAMVEVAGERGADGATVGHVVARSRVSRRTFYELFADREDCLLAAFELAVQRAAESVLPAYRSGGEWRERTRAGLGALLEFLDDEPGFGRLCVVDSLGADSRILVRRAQTIELLIDAVDRGREVARGRERLTRLTAEGVVGAVLAVLHRRLVEESIGVVNGVEGGKRSAHEQAPSMVGLLGPLMGIVVLPYLGRAAANRESANPGPRRRPTTHPRPDPLRDLGIRLTYRTARVLVAIASQPGASNRRVGEASGIFDQGQISKLLARLENHGLICNDGMGPTRGEPNIWKLTSKGQQIEHAIRRQITPPSAPLVSR